MRRIELRFLLPDLWLAAWVIVASALLVHTAGSRWVVYGALLSLGLAVLTADIWQSRQRGLPSRPTAAAWVLAGAVALTGLMIGSDDPRHAQAFMPVLCAVAAATASQRGSRRAKCLPLQS